MIETYNKYFDREKLLIDAIAMTSRDKGELFGDFEIFYNYNGNDCNNISSLVDQYLDFITNSLHNNPNLELDNEFDIERWGGSTVDVSYVEDTSISNENGKQYGHYEYRFTIWMENADPTIVLFQIINHN